MKKLKCLRCSHEWATRIETKPKSCPSCKRYQWDAKVEHDDRGRD